jgi:hypothetical protein
MRQKPLFSLLFPLFDGIIQEKVDQDCIDLGVGMVPQDLPLDQLNAPYTAS